MFITVGDGTYGWLEYSWCMRAYEDLSLKDPIVVTHPRELVITADAFTQNTFRSTAATPLHEVVIFLLEASSQGEKMFQF